MLLCLHAAPMSNGSMPIDRPRGSVPGIGIDWNTLTIEACQIAFVRLYAAPSRINSKRQK